MSKDPAFLFYAKDYYEGTRTMLPRERACYIDLLVYQHQHGIIPNDLERMCMYCSGIDEATLQATLQAKFKQTDEGWLNTKLGSIIKDRKDFSEKQRKNGVVGQLWKKARKVNKYDSLRTVLSGKNNEEIYQILTENYEGSAEAMLQAMLKHLEDVSAVANEDAIEIVNEISNKNGVGKKMDCFDIDDDDEPSFSYSPESFEIELKEFLKEDRKYIWEQYDSHNCKNILAKILSIEDKAYEYFLKLYKSMDDFHSNNFNLKYFDKHFNKINGGFQNGGKKNSRDSKDGYESDDWAEEMSKVSA